MRGVGVLSHAKPEAYQHLEFETPSVDAPKDVIIKVHAASINPVDVKKAAGMMKAAGIDRFPYKIGYDCSGVVTEVGPDVIRVAVGDQVYTRLPEVSRGSWSEYVKCQEEFIALKPQSMSFKDAAAMPLAAMTCLQALRKYESSLAGKTVFIPAGLSGTGSYGCQLAKNSFGAGKVITTVSTSKMPLVDKLLGKGVVDEVIDYTKSDPKAVIPRGSVDFILDTVGAAMDYLSLLRSGTGLVISISTLPAGDQLQASSVMRVPHAPVLPIYVRSALNLMDSIRRLRARRWHVKYEYLFLDPNGEDLDFLRRLVEQGKLTSVVGREVNFEDIDGVREASQVIYSGKGGIGKAVLVFS